MVADNIIIHHSLTADSRTVSWQAIREYHINHNGWHDIGYHFGIEKIGDGYEVIVGRMLNETGAHCRSHNRDSIGICVVGNFDINRPPLPQWYLTVRLVAGLLVMMNADTSAVHGHNEYSDKSCPGKLFDMDRFRHDVGELI